MPCTILWLYIWSHRTQLKRNWSHDVESGKVIKSQNALCGTCFERGVPVGLYLSRDSSTGSCDFELEACAVFRRYTLVVRYWFIGASTCTLFDLIPSREMAERKRKIVEPSIDCIESLRDENKFLTNSPKKSSSTITCGVLTKSPLKGTKNGKMFSMRLCDSNPSISARAVCFDESKYNLFEPTKTYDVGKFKIKKGYGNTNEIELVIDDSSEIRESEHQFRIERSSFNIAQVIRGEAKNVRFISVKGKVLDISDIETVGKFPDLKQKREVVVGDSSGHIILVLWRDRANDIEFSVGDVLKPASRK